MAMRGQITLLAGLLLLCSLTVFVSCDTKSPQVKIKVEKLPDDIKISCLETGFSVYKGDEEMKTPLTLPYSDEHTGEYSCKDKNDKESKIFVKLRTCDNCIEVDQATVAGMAVGNMIATVVIGVAVYLIASQSWTAPLSSHKKSSDRQHLLPNDSSRAPNDHYQPLRHKGQKDTYDKLSNVR